jgi:tetratricopeptide (TPR) repeat protein
MNATDPAAAPAPRPGPAARLVPLAGLVLVATVVAAAVLTAPAITPPAVGPGGQPAVADLFRAGFAAAGVGDARPARRAIRELRGRGAAPAADVVEARLLVARGFVQPALDGLAAINAAALDAGPAGAAVRRGSLIVLAEAAARAGRHADVTNILEPLVAEAPDDVDAHRLLAASWYDIGAIDPAIHHLRETARLAPRDPRPHRLLGLIHNDYERYEDAIGFYEESLRRGPDQPDRDELLLELAACQSKALAHEAALATLDRAPRGTAADLLRAECLVALGRIAEARGLVAAALAASPADLAALVLEGTILLEDGRAADAAAALSRAIGGHPHDYVARVKLAQALDRAGRADDAAREREAAARIRGLREEFAELHREAWDHPRDPRVRTRLAETAAALGRPDLAEVWRAAAAALEAAAPPAAPARNR